MALLSTLPFGAGRCKLKRVVPPRYLLKIMTDRQVFMIMSLLPLSLVGLAAFLPDKKVAEGKAGDHNLRAKAQQLYKTVMMPEIFYPTAFIFILNATPSTGSAWFFFYSSKPPLGLGFTPEFLGTINVVGSVFNLGGQTRFSYLPSVSLLPVPPHPFINPLPFGCWSTSSPCSPCPSIPSSIHCHSAVGQPRLLAPRASIPCIDLQTSIQLPLTFSLMILPFAHFRCVAAADADAAIPSAQVSFSSRLSSRKCRLGPSSSGVLWCRRR
jgi:hypothetical protein